jgi:predicted TPR repeat methyltransferase
MRGSWDPRRLYDIYRTTGMDAGPEKGDLRRGKKAHLIANVMPYLPQDRSAVITDLACGSGELLQLLTSAGYTKISGVDISPEQVARAAAQGIDCVELGDVTDFLKARQAQIDAITAIDFLEHLTKAEVLEMLELSSLALRKGGRLILQTCNGTSPFAGNYIYGDFTHQSAFTARSVRQLLTAVGLSNIRIHEVQPASRTLYGRIRRGLWQIARLGLVSYLAVETGTVRGHIVSQNLIAIADK